MGKILAGIGKIVLAVFTVAVIGLMALLSYETLGRVYPDDPVKQVYGLVLFSFGTIAWFVIFLFASRSGQRPLALLLFVISLVGEIVYAAADTFMGGQNWVAVDTRLGEYVLWTFIAMTFAHGVGLYVHFIIEPGHLEAIEVETMQDEAQAAALAKAKAMTKQHIDTMADIMAKRTMVNVLTGLDLPLPPNVIDAVSVPSAAKPPQDERARASAPAGSFVERPKLDVLDGKPLFTKGVPAVRDDASFQDEKGL